MDRMVGCWSVVMVLIVDGNPEHISELLSNISNKSGILPRIISINTIIYRSFFSNK